MVSSIKDGKSLLNVLSPPAPCEQGIIPDGKLLLNSTQDHTLFIGREEGIITLSETKSPNAFPGSENVSPAFGGQVSELGSREPEYADTSNFSWVPVAQEMTTKLTEALKRTFGCAV